MNNKLRYEDIDSNLYTKNDSNGNAIYFLDKEFKKPFTGEIYVMFKHKIESEAEYKNGYKNGLEYIYYANENLQQINEYKGNVLFGISKEYDENENLISVSIVWNNSYIKVIEIRENQIDKVTFYEEARNIKILPEYIKILLQLSEEELINYEFRPNSPYLDFNK